MVAQVAAPPAETDARGWAHLPPILAGALIGIVGWWAVYSAGRFYGSEANSLGSADELQLALARAVIGLVAFASALAALRWRWVAAGMAGAAIVGIGLSVYLRFANMALVPFGSEPVTPGRALFSGRPLTGAINDLGMAVTEGWHFTPLLLLSAGWIALAIGRRPSGVANRPPVADAGLVALGAAVALVVFWLHAVADRATTAMFVIGEYSPLQPLVVLAIGIGATYLLYRVRIAAYAAAVAAGVLMVFSIIAAGSFSPPADWGQITLRTDIWRFSVEDVLPVWSVASYSANVLVLFGTWVAIAGYRAWRGARSD